MGEGVFEAGWGFYDYWGIGVVRFAGDGAVGSLLNKAVKKVS